MKVIKAVPGNYTVTNPSFIYAQKLRTRHFPKKRTESKITTVMAVEKKQEMAVCFHPFTHSLWQVVDKS